MCYSLDYKSTKFRILVTLLFLVIFITKWSVELLQIEKKWRRKLKEYLFSKILALA